MDYWSCFWPAIHAVNAMANLFWKCFSSDEEANGQSESEEKVPELPLLSEQLLLDELWDMLGECLKELEESHDQHAVLGRRNLHWTGCLSGSFYTKRLFTVTY